MLAQPINPREAAMTRIRVLKREEMSKEQGLVYDTIKASGSPVGGPYYAYIRNPKLMKACTEVSGVLRESALSGRERQIATLVAIRHWGAKYPWAVQVRNSLQAGLDQATIDSINARKAPKLDNPREKAAYDVAIEMLGNRSLSDATYAAAEKLFGVEQLVALVATIGWFCMVSNTANAFDITPPDEAPARLMA
jgi:4-carboxymuconolactone decarboxylase